MCLWWLDHLHFFLCDSELHARSDGWKSLIINSHICNSLSFQKKMLLKSHFLSYNHKCLCVNFMTTWCTRPRACARMHMNTLHQCSTGTEAGACCRGIRLRVCQTQWWGVARGSAWEGRTMEPQCRQSSRGHDEPICQPGRVARATPASDPLLAHTMEGGRSRARGNGGEFPACYNKMESSILVAGGIGHSQATPRIHHNFQRLQWSHFSGSVCSWG